MLRSVYRVDVPEMRKQMRRKREQERKRFMELAERFATEPDAGERERLKEELARLTFGN